MALAPSLPGWKLSTVIEAIVAETVGRLLAVLYVELVDAVMRVVLVDELVLVVLIEVLELELLNVLELLDVLKPLGI